jgi:hypothetical protein
MKLGKSLMSRKGKTTAESAMKELAPRLPEYHVTLDDDVRFRSRRRMLGLALKGAAFLAVWPVLKKESRAAILKDLLGDKAPETARSLTARQAARIISSEIAHKDIPHKNVAHQNVAHTDTHTNTHINETKHINVQPPGFEHTNTQTHMNQNVQGHVNTPHTDAPHQNEPHTNVEHANRPGPSEI